MSVIVGTLSAAAAALVVAATWGAAHADALVRASVDIRGPDLLVAGESATYLGNYRIGGVGVTRARVEVRLDGALAWTGLTNPFGLWQATLPFATGGVHRVTVDVAPPVDLRAYDAHAMLDVRAAVPPGPPRNVTVHATEVADEFRVRWETPADDGLAPVTSYRVTREALAGGGTAHPGATAGLEHRDRVEFDGIYVYRVAASNLAGEGPAGEVVLRAPPAPDANGTSVAVESIEACDGFQFSYCRSASSGGTVELLGGGPVRVRLRLVGNVTFDGAPVPGVRPLARLEGVFPASPAPVTSEATAEGVTGADGRFLVPRAGDLAWGGTPVGTCGATRYTVTAGYGEGSGMAFATLAICRN